MDGEHLVAMANRIAEFFDAMPERTEALDGVAQHIRRFWEPRMRRALVAHAAATGGEGLHPLVAQVLRERSAAVLGS